MTATYDDAWLYVTTVVDDRRRRQAGEAKAPPRCRVGEVQDSDPRYRVGEVEEEIT